MKKLFSFIALSLGLNFTLTDYRDTYVGNYFCRSRTTVYIFNESVATSYDTVTVHITKGIQDSVMNISINNNSYKFKLISGNLYSYDLIDLGGGKFFSTDSFKAIISIGRASSIIYIGKKN
jgi:hypothetical protein